ncbi:unnamed protein product [Discula destructiva]
MAESASRTPVYFLGIGGPNLMENREHPAFKKLGETGRGITTKVKPKAVVVVSAHWQNGPSRVSINYAEETDIIYDFYNFPPHYYEYKYPNKGSPVIDNLAGAGIHVQKVKRGLDHGVLVGFVVAFDPEKNPLKVPIVQLSLYGNEGPDKHYRLGQALQSLREEGVLIVGAGMVVHNLHDYRKSRGSGAVMPYSTEFGAALTEAVTPKPSDRQGSLASLLSSSLARQAHPTFEHILLISVAAGAAGLDDGKRIWALAEGSLNWGQYRFGKVEA